MYAKKDMIYSSTMGLVSVKDVTKFSPDRRTPMMYYVLRSYYDKEKTAYIPVEEHEVELRDLIDSAQAQSELDELSKASLGEPTSDVMKRIGEIAYVLGKNVEDITTAIFGETDE